MTERGVGRALAFLQAAGLKGGPTTAEDRILMIRAWMEVIPDWDDSTIEHAVRTWARASSEPFFPTPGQLISLMTPACGSPDESWFYVCACLQKMGKSEPSRFDTSDPEETAIRCGIAAVGGWKTLHQTPLDERKWQKKAFTTAYEESMKRSRTQDATLLISEHLTTKRITRNA